MTPTNLDEVRELAEARLDASAWDYYRSGAHDELTLARNESAWREIELRYRVLRDVSQRDTRTTVIGREVASPIIVAPTAFHGLAHPDAELATVRGANAAGSVFTLSSLSNTAMEDVVAAATVPVWFQLYVYRDRGATHALVERAEAAGAEALVLTVDAPLLGVRERDVKNRFHLPKHLSVKNLRADGKDAIDEGEGSGLARYFADELDPSLSFADLDALTKKTRLPVLVKGVVRGDDALHAIDAGARAVIVSNHGGRQLDTSVATADALPDVIEHVAGRAEVLVDGGIRRGTDVLKALAMGARAVLVGRPVLWGLAWDGAHGVEVVLGHLRAELDLAMALAGCPTIASITPDLLERHQRSVRSR